MDEYDEFGNYIGEVRTRPEEEDEDERQGDVSMRVEEDDEDDDMFPNGSISDAIVLHEDKALYPSARSVFGDGVELITEDDSAPTTKDKAKPLLAKDSILKEKKRRHPPKTSEDLFEEFIMATPSLVRSIAVVGHLHSGKSSLVSFLHRKKHDSEANAMKTCNVREDERAMKISLKTRAIASTCSDSQGKSFHLNTLDTPGHVNFLDEVECALELVDGAILTVDCVEGVQLGTETAVSSLARHGLLDFTVVVLTKIDRLIHELKLPPSEAQFKLMYVLEQIDELFARYDARKLDVEKGRVLFASAAHGFAFSLESMARLTSKNSSDTESVAKLASLLWGDVFYHAESRRFSSRRTSNDARRTFEHFCLDPIYKIYSHVLGSEPKDLANELEGLKLTKRDESKDALQLLKTCLQRTMPGREVLVDSLSAHVQPSNDFCAERLAGSGWAGGELLTEWGKSVIKTDPEGPLLVHGTKLVYPQDDPFDVLDDEESLSATLGSEVKFRVLARVFSGTLRVGDVISILDPAVSSAYHEEDSVTKAKVSSLRLPSRGGGAPCRLIDSAGPGAIVLIGGVDEYIAKSATLGNTASIPRFPPLRFLRGNSSSTSRVAPVCKVALEPLIPSELPKMQSGLRAVQKSYPGSRVEVEESGEYVLRGIGELYLDSIMRDLRERFAKGTEIKIVDPFVALQETVTAQSSRITKLTTPNGLNEFDLIAEPLEEKLVRDLDFGWVQKQVGQEGKSMEKILRTEYGFDILAARSVWAFGPDEFSPNAFLDDTLPPNKPQRLEDVRDSIVEGFRWAAREGPLCSESCRGVKLKLLSANIALEDRDRAPGQVIKTLRRSCHETILASAPALVEPVFTIDALITEARSINLVRNALTSRRGGTREVVQVPGTQLHRLKGFVPVLDSFGLETEIRLRSRGAVLPQMYFEGWSVVPGDPLDDSIMLKPLEPSPPEYLARDLVVKTRRRKGLPEMIEQVRLDPQVLLSELKNGKIT